MKKNNTTLAEIISYLEDIIEEIVDQIVSKVAIQANVNVIKTNDGTLGTILDIKS